MNCSECPLYAEYFCSCNGKTTILCREHIYSHIGDLHQLNNLYFRPDYNERVQAVSNIYRIIKDLDSTNDKKIKETYQELEKIKEKLKSTLGLIEVDISALQNLIKKIFTTTEFSRTDKTCSLFRCPYEAVIKTLVNDNFINPHNYSTEIISSFLRIDNIQNPLSSNLKEESKISNETLKKNAIWSKLGDNGEFMPYSLADNEIIENAFQSSKDLVYIGEMNSQRYINLRNPAIEIQEGRKKRVTTVLRNDGSENLTNSRYLKSTEKQWRFEIDDEKWESMTSEASRVIEWAFQNEVPEAIIQVRRSYKIDIEDMKQTNLQTYSQRKVKRGY
ncbi:unnamed protein product [Blepharisma stoltei]|uniref:WWE domain-containing protein n=1 Tax=Blepharisma stoltei TaxID=1481888 RepID=A0AAU9JBA4_9CILI|nr:unnamed protein product [Blepharisma stoltei]